MFFYVESQALRLTVFIQCVVSTALSTVFTACLRLYHKNIILALVKVMFLTLQNLCKIHYTINLYECIVKSSAFNRLGTDLLRVQKGSIISDLLTFLAMPFSRFLTISQLSKDILLLYNDTTYRCSRLSQQAYFQRCGIDTVLYKILSILFKMYMHL